MKPLGSLSRQIVRSMTLLALSVTLMMVVGSYIFYSLMLTISPESLSSSDQLMPTTMEWFWMAATTLLALVIAVVLAIRLARRILVPLNSVAHSLRQIAEGELNARAETDDYSLGEAALLVRDFNTMAERLERMAQERAFWNAAIAHELRTPVTILRGRLQGLTEGVFEPDIGLFRNLLTQVEGLGRLIEDLRVVGLAESGHLELRWTQTRLSDEVMAVVSAFEPTLQHDGFTLSLALGDQVVQCDPVRIRQALLALLENAQKHADPGRLCIRAGVDGGRAFLSVEDDGPGIDPQLADQIFEAFQRGEQSRSGNSKGSGLGLAVVQAIAQAHGGQASCCPSPSGGARFELRWPAAGRISGLSVSGLSVSGQATSGQSINGQSISGQSINGQSGNGPSVSGQSGTV
ncbi:ATP-binding protein [Dickeya solani]|uniref:histidine kinase n=2 Tax=Dickeya solani TaxID=1089444 RepID=A0ABU4ED40_9GAMM|nr:ATP-binding protein [Dickeya solani]MCA6998143.1 HAMP domain-containing protein [Dickeya solani]MCZ0823626.1 ATP-binding protein [Dickeya solani]MDV6995502.1 ATP-binding protein [Dickeya solani]MDV7003116.1 ATP-binding protein [Dickeya solani]MDV7037982.1 ATP-binding protein [Dickeya solani]